MFTRKLFLHVILFRFILPIELRVIICEDYFPFWPNERTILTLHEIQEQKEKTWNYNNTIHGDFIGDIDILEIVCPLLSNIIDFDDGKIIGLTWYVNKKENKFVYGPACSPYIIEFCCNKRPPLSYLNAAYFEDADFMLTLMNSSLPLQDLTEEKLTRDVFRCYRNRVLSILDS